MAVGSGLLCRDRRGEAGFTIIESVVAAAILVIAILLTVTPLVTSMRALDRSKDVTVAESLAQGRIEQVRAMAFDDIGHPGSAPQGVIDRLETTTVEGANFEIETIVEYVGSLSGLNIVPQGGDGVEGSFDIGVNYKYVRVVVSPTSGGADPVTMETFIAPPTVGGLDDIAVIEVIVDRHEPYDPGPDPVPFVRIEGPASHTSLESEATQYFADVSPGDYTISVVSPDGWLIHPETIDSVATAVTATVGTRAQRTIRVFQPVALNVTVLDDATGLPVSDAVLTATNQAYGPPTTNSPGDYSFVDLVPDRYTVDAAAPGYQSVAVEVDVPGFGGGTGATATVRLVAQTWVGVDYDFYVDYEGWSDYYVSGATVLVSHPGLGTFAGTTDETGHTVISLPENTSGFTVTATTSWGHGPASQSLTTGAGPGSASLSLEKPATTDRFRLRNGGPGPGGFYEYKVGTDPWMQLLANDQGTATFIVPEDDGTVVQLRTFCSPGDYPAAPASTTSTTLNGNDKSWNAGASC